MQLKVSDVATLFEVSERTVLRWVRAGEIPAHSVNAEYRFSRAEILEWATTQRRQVPAALFADLDSPGLADSLRAGGAHREIPGDSVRAVLTAMVERLALPDGADRRAVLEMLLAREASGTTAVGDGIAIPHVRSPLVIGSGHPTATVCYLAQPVDFSAPDGQPVRVLFTLVSPTVRVHLQLLARLAFALRTPEFRSAVGRQGGLGELVAAADKVDVVAPKPGS